MSYNYNVSTLRCGPGALAYAGGWTIADVIKRWPGGWHDHLDWRDDVNDWPDDHRLVIESYGKAQKMVTLTEVLSGEGLPHGGVVVLLHSDNVLCKHWVVWEGNTETHVKCHWGDGTIKALTIAQFATAFAAAETRLFGASKVKLAGKCAYRIVDAPIKLSNWQRFRRWFLGLAAKLS